MNTFDDVDDKLFAFQSLYCRVLNDHAPMKQVHVRGNQVPYMTDQWRRAIRHRNHLWRHFTRDKSDTNYAAYKTQRNVCTSLRRKAIKGHFIKRSEEIDQDPRQFWNTYRPFLHSKKSFKSNDIILKENEQIKTEKADIANIFNEYFINIANHINIPSSDVYGEKFVNHPSIKTILQNTNEIGASRFGFQPTSIACVEKLLKEVKTKKSPGHDNIQPRLLRESATVIAAPLTSLINHSIDQSKYPSVWKKGQITPLLKSNGNDMYKNFYRPVCFASTY